MRMRKKTALFLTCLLLSGLCFAATASAATERRVALVIGNGQYDTGRLKNPVNDATDMAAALQRLGFTVVLKKNARQQDMEEAIEDFGNRLKRGGVGLFYYAGHGVQVAGVNYLIPIGARINKESDVRFHAVDAGKVLAEMENANNGLNIVILDACRDNPFARSFRSSSRGLAIVSNAPAGTFISYSTGAGQVARDGEGRNSPYTATLIQYMKEPGLAIEEVFKGVRQKLRRETGQVPWELSSLEGRFYFRPGRAVDSAPAAASPLIDSAAGQKKAGEVSPAQKAASEEEKQEVAVARPPEFPAVKEIGRDGRFIAYDNGTVLDTKTNLMWAAKDSQKLITWPEARIYCEQYRGGGYSDWRMPALQEIASLYDAGKRSRMTSFIEIMQCCPWSSETRGSEAAYFTFSFGTSVWTQQNGGSPVLPVRSSISKPAEIGRDGRFIAYSDGTVLDTRTNLMWAATDEGNGVNWTDAKGYCENYRGGGYKNWRLPAKSELVELYKSVNHYAKSGCGRDAHLTEWIRLNCSTWVWASETRGSDAAYLSFGALGTPEWNPQSDRSLQALPVRSAIAR